MDDQSRKFQAAQAKAEQAAHDVQRQINASYRQGYLDGSVDERQYMTDDLRNTLNSFSQKCQTRARTQATDLDATADLDSPEVVENGDELGPGAIH